MDVKNKVDKDDVENVIKEDKLTKLDADERDYAYKAGMLVGIGAVIAGYIVGSSLMTILSNKHHN